MTQKPVDSTVKTDNEEEEQIDWDDDPNIFVFQNEKLGSVKMNVFPLDMKNWIRIDKNYPLHLKLRKEILRDKLDHVFATKDENLTRQSEQELFEMICKHLLSHFPKIYEATKSGIHNRVTKETIPWKADENPIIRAARLTQEDWCIMEWSEKKRAYVLTSGVVCFPSGWSMAGKHNMAMNHIHAPVDPFREHLETKAHNLMNRLKPEKPMWRANWGIFNNLDGPLDLYAPGGRHKQQTLYLGEQTGKDLVFRAEYQTLVRLPKTKSIVFSIRTYQRFLSDFKNLPKEIARDLLVAIEHLDKDVFKYKDARFWAVAATKYLKRNVLEQDSSMTTSNWILIALAIGAMSIGLVYLNKCIVIHSSEELEAS